MEKTREEHVVLWRASGLSRRAYARQAGLVYVTFCKWCRGAVDDGSHFIALSSVAKHSPGLRIEFPNGVILHSEVELSLDLLRTLYHV